MSKDKTTDSGTEYPGDAGLEDEDDTLDLTEAMAVGPSDNGNAEDDTVGLANVPTVIGDLSGGEALGSGSETPAETETDEEVLDLAAAAAPAPGPPAFEDDDEFEGPQQTVAISPQEYSRMGLARSEAGEDADPAAEESGSAAARNADLSGEDTIREQDTEAPSEDTLREEATDVETTLLVGGDQWDAPTETDADGDDNGDPFWDIDTGTLVAMGKEFDADAGETDDPEILDLGAMAPSSEASPPDDEVLDLGATAAPLDGEGEGDEVLDLGAVAAPADGSDRDAETVFAPPPTDAGTDDETPVDAVDRDASTVLMPTDAGDRDAETVLMPVEDGASETSAPGLLSDDEFGDGERDVKTLFIPGLAESEGADSSDEREAADRDAETVFLSPEMAAGGEIGEDNVSASQETPSSDDAESASAAAIPSGGFSDWEASRSESEADEGPEAADPDAETLLMSLGDWGAEEEETDPTQLSALELLDSISELPEGAETETDEMTVPEDETVPSGDMYDILGAHRVSETGFGRTDGEKTAAAEESADETADAATPSGKKAAGSTDDDGGETQEDPKAVALPEAHRRSDSGEERCFSITPDQMQTILERVVDKIFSEKIEKILTDVIERAVADEMRKLESYFFEELDDRGDH